jgi:iron complex transport system permease protein
MSEAHRTAAPGGITPDEQPAAPHATTAAPDRAAAADPAAAPGSAGVIVLAAVALLWLAGMLWSARATITGRTEAEMEVTSTAYALPGAISANLVAGAAIALVALSLLTRGGRRPGASVRFGTASAAGLVTGLLAAATVVTINTEGWLYAVVGGTLAAAATLGGAVAGARAGRVVAAVCWASLAVFALGLALNLFQGPLLRLFGAGGDQAAQAGAVTWFAMTQSVTSGFTAGLIAYLTLRLAQNRSAGTALAWPLYALAGAGPGLLLVVAEGLARTAGARVLELAGKVSEVEFAAQNMLSGSRFNNALIVLFVGTITAIIAIGRTLRPAPED